MNKNNLKDGFTLVEVIILFVIFITVAVLVVPLAVDDAVTAKNTAEWQRVQSSFASIPISMMNTQKYKQSGVVSLEHFITALIKVHPLRNVVSYKIKYMNGDPSDGIYKFNEIYNTDFGASIAFNWFEDKDKVLGEDRMEGVLMYDVNGKRGPNVWGKDVFGMNIYANKIEPFGKGVDPMTVETDCSRQGRGLYCSYAVLHNVQEP